MSGEQNDRVLDDPGAYTRAELEALEAAGDIQIVPPGTPEAAAFDREMAAQAGEDDDTYEGA